MSEEIVRKWMITEPIAVSSTTLLPDAYWMMVKKKIKRLLVVDEGKLIGILTKDDVRSVIPPSVIAMDPIKLNDLLCRMQVRQVMKTKLYTIQPEETLIEAARRMLDHDISALPVVEGDKVVGIINDRCIFRVLVEGGK